MPSSSRSKRAQPVEDAQTLGDVALGGERLHQQHVARLAILLGLDQRPGVAFHRGELRPPEMQPGPRDQLERLQPDVLELAPPRLEPRSPATPGAARGWRY